MLQLETTSRIADAPNWPGMGQERFGVLVRRSFLFTDLANFTAWAGSRVEREDCSRLRAALEEMCESVLRHGGELVKLRGDGVHASFGSPGDALWCAVDIERRAGLTAYDGTQSFPPVRVGLAAGPCIRYCLCSRWDYHGPVVNLAARLASTGDSCHVLMSEAFARDPAVSAMLDAVSVEDLSMVLRGVDEHVHVFRLTAGEIHRFLERRSSPQLAAQKWILADALELAV